MASDIYSDAKSLTPQAAYSNSMNSTFQKEVNDSFTNLRGVEGITIDDKTSISNKIYSRLDFSGAENQIKNYFQSSQSITKIMKDPTFDKETYYEDILGLENYEGTEDEDKLIVEGLAGDMFEQAKKLNRPVSSYTAPSSTPTPSRTKVTNFLDTVQATPTTKTKYKTLLNTYDGFIVEKDGKQLTGREVGALDMIKQVKSAEQFKYGTNLTDVLTNEELNKEINLALSDDKETRETSILRTKAGYGVKNARSGRLRKKLEALKNKLAAGIGDESKMKAYQLTVIDDDDNSILVPEFDSNGNFKPILEIDNNTSLDSHTKVLSLLPNVGTGNTGVKLTTEIYDIVGRYNSYNK